MFKGSTLFPWTHFDRRTHTLGNNVTDPDERRQWLQDNRYRVTWVRESSQQGNYGWAYETRCFPTEEQAKFAASLPMRAFSVAVDALEFGPNGEMLRETTPLWKRKPKQKLQRDYPRRR